MLRQVSSRNHRSKGYKLKNALQICLLVVVTTWLLYQVKHSYDKKTEYEEGNGHLSIKDDGGRNEVFKFGRKDPPQDLPFTAITDSATPDGRSAEDEASEEDLEQELKHGENDERDAIDEQDREGGDDDGDGDGSGAPESEEADGGEGDEPSVFEDLESKEGAHAAREKSFRGDDVASAVVHDSRPKAHEDHSREAREKSFNGDNVSSAVDHEDHLENTENKAAGNENSTVIDSTSGKILEFSSDGGSKDHEMTQNHKVSPNSTVDEPNNRTGQRVDLTATNVNGNQSETPISSSDKTTDKEVPESPMNTTTTVLNNQIELLTNLTAPQQNETANLGSNLGSGSAVGIQTQTPGDDKFDGISTTSPASGEEGERKVEFQDTSRNIAEGTREAPNASSTSPRIEEKARRSGEEAVLE